MANLNILALLQREARGLEEQLANVNGAIAALRGKGEIPFPRRRRRGRPRKAAKADRREAGNGRRKRRRISAAGRRRISEAQKARWAKLKAGKKK